MKQLLMCLTLIMSCFICKAQQPVLKFNTNGKFKIVQFTDVHFIYGDSRSDMALERIKEVLDAEKPDLVMLTGDIVFAAPAEKGMRTVLEIISERRIPFAFTFGNHDDEHDLTRDELLKVVQSIPYNLTSDTPGISGVGNYILPIKSSSANKDAAVLYCIDSNAYSSIEGVKGYDYIKFDQIQWYRENSMKFTKQNGGSPLPALAFFHIPLPEYAEAATDERAIMVGIRKEKSCPPELNSGMFTAIKEMGDVMGTFVGHDHDNDYAVYWKGVLLCFGRYTGGDTVYNNLPNGARVIEMTEGEHSFKTWIHLKNNEIVHSINYPADFIKK